MVEPNIGTAIMPLFFNLLKWGMYLFIFAIIIIGGIVLIIHLKRRKWYVEIVERKDDGTIHKVKEDVLVERKLAKGTITIYWLTKTKAEVIPPPEECTHRWRKKDYVTYRRIERDYVPMRHEMPEITKEPYERKRMFIIYDKILEKVRSIKTSFFKSDAVRDRFIYIPALRTLSSNFIYHPIDYDMSMMAQNKIQHADEFFKMKGEWWAKYGNYIIFAITIIFLIILIALTYEFIAGKITEIVATGGQVASALEKASAGLGNIGTKPPI
jgi:uncharacterized membrane protein